MLKDMGTDDDEPTARDRYELLLQDPRWAILGAERDGHLAGYAAIQDYGPHLRLGDLHRMSRLHDLYVRPDDRRHGVGAALMDAVKTWAAAHVRYVLWQAGRQTSAPFYEHLGYAGEVFPQPTHPTFCLDVTEPHHP